MTVARILRPLNSLPKVYDPTRESGMKFDVQPRNPRLVEAERPEIPFGYDWRSGRYGLSTEKERRD